MEEKSYFDGGLLQLIGWRLLGTLVTILTLGLCLPWAYCMIYRWEAKHTVIDGERLYFDGKAAQLFGSWIKWILLTVITLGIYGFWLPIKFAKWKTKHTHHVEDKKPQPVTTNININIPSEHNPRPGSTAPEEPRLVSIPVEPVQPSPTPSVPEEPRPVSTPVETAQPSPTPSTPESTTVEQPTSTENNTSI